MIDELEIRNLGVISHARLEPGAGLTVITGETGAGKTMILTGLGLLMGAKADAGHVRTQETEAAVTGRFTVPDGMLAGVGGPESDAAASVSSERPHAAAPGDEGQAEADGSTTTLAQQLADTGAQLDDDGSLLASRTVAAAGRSRSYLGGRPVPAAVLGSVVSSLVTIHGQNDQARLRSAAHQRAALDEFGGPDHGAALDRYRDTWDRLRTVAATLVEWEATAAERAREAELLRLGLDAIARVDPQPSEDVTLAAQAARLRHATDLGQEITVARAALDPGSVGDDPEPGGAQPGALTAIEVARRAVERAAEHDPSLASLRATLDDLGYRIQDVAAELAGYAADLEFDPAALEATEARRAELGHLTRSYGEDIAAVLAWANTAAERLDELVAGDERIPQLRGERDRLEAQLAAQAEIVSQGRTNAAARLEALVGAELAGLAMPDASLKVQLTPIPAGPWGADGVELLLVAHRGAPARALHKGASGGELSRVMLAIEVALAHPHDEDGPTVESQATMVFDEVDAGVGGRAAVEVGARLARLARSRQVIVITHLAQVAAFAGTHIVVNKSMAADGATVASDVRVVDAEERLDELARMLSGAGSSTARAHAAELLASAAEVNAAE